MYRSTFKGGCHPFEGKEMSSTKPVVTLEPGPELVFPLLQHAGAPAVPVVQAGDEVLAGQLIAEANGAVSANIHSSVSGKVKAIQKRPLPTGGVGMSIVITNDNEYREVEYKPASLDSLSREEILARIRAAGVVGMGGAGFPADAKFNPDNYDKIENLVVNGAECEPYLTSDYKTMVDSPDRVIGGIKIALKLLPNATAVIGIEDNKPDAVSIFREKCVNEPKIEVAKVKTKYPQGSDRMLVYSTTGKKVSPKERSNKYGVVVSNVATLASIYDAVIEGKPSIDRIFTVSGDDIANPGNFKVRLGTPYSEVLEAAGGTIQDPEKYINGGTMMGFAMYDLTASITKTAASLLALKKDEVSANEPPTPCINCGSCGTVCPINLVPNKMYKLAQNGDKEGFLKIYGDYCIGCGCCSYVCPAKIPLKQGFKTMNTLIKAENKKRRAEVKK